MVLNIFIHQNIRRSINMEGPIKILISFKEYLQVLNTQLDYTDICGGSHKNTYRRWY